DAKYIVNNKYKIEIEAVDAAKSTADDSVYVQLKATGPTLPPGPCEEVRDELKKEIKRLIEEGMDLEKKSIQKICTDPFKGKFVTGYQSPGLLKQRRTEFFNITLNGPYRKDINVFKKIVVSKAKKTAKAAKKAMETFRPELIEKLNWIKDSDREWDIAITRNQHEPLSIIINNIEGEERIHRLYGALPSLDGIDQRHKEDIEEMRKLANGKESYRRYTFFFYPRVLLLLEELLAAVEVLCGEGKVKEPEKLPEGKVVALPPAKGLKALPPGERVEPPVDILKRLKSVNMDEVERIAGNIRTMRKFVIDPDLQRAIKDIKTEIARGTNPLFGKTYQVVIREDYMHGNFYRPMRYEIVIGGKSFTRGAELDKSGKPFPPGVGPTVFAQAIFDKLGYITKDDQGRTIGVAHKIVDATGAIRLMTMFRIGLIKTDINLLHAESAKLPDKESVRIMDKFINALEDESKKLEHVVVRLQDVERNTCEVKNMSNEYIQSFIKSVENAAKDHEQWGTGGQWTGKPSGEDREDDSGIDHLVHSLRSFKDIPEFLKMVQDEAIKHAEDAINVMTDALTEIRKIEAEWKTHLEEVMRLHYGAAA
ncbi:MAG: hypothetical protein KJ574_00525, partial [Nanoarchaeota archaeon]|nr:hypothetical protein [Nanoarchaeota archaeon]